MQSKIAVGSAAQRQGVEGRHPDRAALPAEQHTEHHLGLGRGARLLSCLLLLLLTGRLIGSLGVAFTAAGRFGAFVAVRRRRDDLLAGVENIGW